MRITEDHMIEDQINHSKKTIEVGLEMDLSTLKVKTG